MVRAGLLFVGVAISVSGQVFADSITVQGKTFSDVYVIASDSRYYVQFPGDGSVQSFSKNDVPKSAVNITSDTEKRAALLQAWKLSNAKKHGQTGTEPVALDIPDLDGSGNALGGAHGALAVNVPARKQPAEAKANSISQPRGSGYIAQISLKEVPLRVALKAILRPMNLDYEVRDGYIWISTPERLRKEAYEELETRIYELKNAGAETLPKIVVQNNGGRQGSFNTNGNQGTSGAGGGFGPSNSAFAGSTQGFAGASGGGGSSSGGNAQFSNISQLFSTIDDRMVGETPSVIGSQGLSAGRAAVGGRGQAFTNGGTGASVGGGGSTGRNAAGAQFSNISQLFSTIDDRLVGESPAYIGR